MPDRGHGDLRENLDQTMKQDWLRILISESEVEVVFVGLRDTWVDCNWFTK